MCLNVESKRGHLTVVRGLSYDSIFLKRGRHGSIFVLPTDMRHMWYATGRLPCSITHTTIHKGALNTRSILFLWDDLTQYDRPFRRPCHSVPDALASPNRMLANPGLQAHIVLELCNLSRQEHAICMTTLPRVVSAGFLVQYIRCLDVHWVF